MCAVQFLHSKVFFNSNWRHSFQKSWDVVCSFIFEKHQNYCNMACIHRYFHSKCINSVILFCKHMIVYILLFLKKIMFHIIICVLRLWTFIFSSLHCCGFSLFYYRVGQDGTLGQIILSVYFAVKTLQREKNCWLCAMKSGEGNISSNFYSIAPPFLVSFLELALTKIHMSTLYFFIFFIKLLIFCDSRATSFRYFHLWLSLAKETIFFRVPLYLRCSQFEGNDRRRGTEVWFTGWFFLSRVTLVKPATARQQRLGLFPSSRTERGGVVNSLGIEGHLEMAWVAF